MRFSVHRKSYWRSSAQWIRTVERGDFLLTGSANIRESLKRKTSLMRGVVLHAGKARPLDAGDLALSWGWMVPKS